MTHSAPVACSRTGKPRRSGARHQHQRASARAADLLHEEGAQEDFLVLAGECVLLVNREERSRRAWDFVHTPARTERVILCV
jgi:hypothetical protein